MGAINIITLPGYYYLYALYYDYPINNAFFGGAEHGARMRELVRVVQSIQALRAPYRKSWPVRLFTERDGVARFSPEAVNSLLFLLRETVERMGPPPGWRRGPLPHIAPPRSHRPPRGDGHASGPSSALPPPRPRSPYPPPPFPIHLSA